MITFDGEYTLMLHMEETEDQALERGGVNIDEVKQNIASLIDWLLAAISENIELKDTDYVSIIPNELKLVMNDKEIPLDENEDDE